MTAILLALVAVLLLLWIVGLMGGLRVRWQLLIALAVTIAIVYATNGSAP